MKFSTIESCRVCHSKSLEPILDLGEQPLANALKKHRDEVEFSYPLRISFCTKCSLVQLNETVDKELLFRNYVWITGTSQAAKDYAQTFFSRVVKTTGILPGDLVVEIASNDGTFLKPFLQNGFKVQGVDPAQNIAAMAVQNGVPTLAEFWNRPTAQQVRTEKGAPRVIMARNVIPHVSELHEVISSMEYCLADDGVGIIEFHDAGFIFEELHYDSIYHEHLCYFSIKSMEALLRQFHLEPFHIDPSPISGGSHVIYFTKKIRARPITENYKTAVQRENRLGITEYATWKEFAQRCYAHRDKSKLFLEQYISQGHKVLGFGASARSSTYLNFCRFDYKQIEAIIDNNALKQGLYTAGSSIPIVSFADGLQRKPGLLFLIAWNFTEEIKAECLKGGYRGDYLIPFPKEPRISKG